MATICDGKHDEMVAAKKTFVGQMQVQVDGVNLVVGLQVEAPGKDYCPECFLAMARKIDLSKALPEAIEKQEDAAKAQAARRQGRIDAKAASKKKQEEAAIRAAARVKEKEKLKAKRVEARKKAKAKQAADDKKRIEARDKKRAADAKKKKDSDK